MTVTDPEIATTFQPVFSTFIFYRKRDGWRKKEQGKKEQEFLPCGGVFGILLMSLHVIQCYEGSSQQWIEIALQKTLFSFGFFLFLPISFFFLPILHFFSLAPDFSLQHSSEFFKRNNMSTSFASLLIHVIVLIDANLFRKFMFMLGCCFGKETTLNTHSKLFDRLLILFLLPFLPLDPSFVLFFIQRLKGSPYSKCPFFHLHP